MSEVKKRKFRKDHKFKFTKEQLRKEIRAALLWTSDGLEFHVSGKPEDSQPLVMGDVENLTVILTLALTEGLPAEEDSSTSTTA
jgi:hypothetical protein